MRWIIRKVNDIVETLVISQDARGNKVVLIPNIIFANKQNIDWKEVETYLERYVGDIVEIAESKDIIYLGKNFPNKNIKKSLK